MAEEAIKDVYTVVNGGTIDHEWYRELDTVLITSENLSEYIDY